MGLKVKNVDIMGVQQFLGEGGHKKKYIYIYMGNCLKREAWQKIGSRVFLRRVGTSMHTMALFWVYART